MARKFTAEQAFAAATAGEPIMVSRPAAHRICRDHGAELGDYEHDTGDIAADEIAADRLLGWLGY